MHSVKKLIFLLTLLTSLVFVSQGNTLHGPDEMLSGEEDDGGYESASAGDTLNLDDSVSLRGIGRLLSQSKSSRVPAAATCDRYPKVCQVKGSQGRDCCKKKCVDRMTDGLNCGKCGVKCKYSEICCKGKCVNPMSDKLHCGGCNNKCMRAKGKCIYGMCSYA